MIRNDSIVSLPQKGSVTVTESELLAPKDRRTQELVIALVGPVASGCTTAKAILENTLETQYGYTVIPYKPSDQIASSAKLLSENIEVGLTGSNRIAKYQAVGNTLREKFGNNYLVAKIIERIHSIRQEKGFKPAKGGEAKVPQSLRYAHIIDSLKHPAELDLLRETYGDIFWVFGVFAPEDIRKERLKKNSPSEAEITKIIEKDYGENDDFGQQVSDAFHKADFFVRNDHPNDVELRKSLERYLEILFAIPVHSPTSDETAMHAAHAQAAISGCLSRQVGAVIVSKKGEIIGLGRNDVPKFGGGLYSEEDGKDDHRCYKWADKICHNDERKNRLYEAACDKLKPLLKEDINTQAVEDALKQTDIKQLIEYSRAVHAEMEAIISVARGEKTGIVGSTLYCTTFPCHSCARHIVASGIEKVVFIEPYPKSLATVLHSDSVSVKENTTERRVRFIQYEGVAPQNILRLFRLDSTKRPRKEKGRFILMDKKMAQPIITTSLDDYSTHEQWVIGKLAISEKNNER
ncbi:anti-phage dCTP deaminase [Nitrosovibrio tenuis]|uniref:Deoxycytidylate deaminase n=1 Tax=Nitrosovibrio tenuis TaxID=1233 RepID=A0A1H7R738_9PROT|nr:anti-phage dCTP deaminase [Nitrosovibrio tenuis]SEL56066.1 Deoxycytidylate deaminase [Nitrosovibrio tenuis]